MKPKIHTKLADWMRAASPQQRLLLAELAGTSVGYLKLLAGCHRENPSIRLSLLLIGAAAILKTRKLPKLTLQDLATPTRRD